MLMRGTGKQLRSTTADSSQLERGAEEVEFDEVGKAVTRGGKREEEVSE